MKFLHNDTHTILGELKTFIFERNKTTKPLVVMNERIIQVYISEMHSVTHDKVLEKWLREAFRVHTEKRAQEYSEEFNFEYNRIAIKDTKTRWGSCSSKKNLNFNWRLVFTPLECIDYVIVHELAHTKEMNHSKKFWYIVESIMPNYKELRNILRTYEPKVLKR